MRTNKEKLFEICIACLKELHLTSDKFKKRLKEEFREIEVQDYYDYFLNQLKSGNKWDENTNNLLVPYLLGLCDDININESYSFNIGEFPDIDVDYLEEVSTQLKTVWAPKQFGEDYIANIGTHTVYSVKQSLTDMARIFGANYDEVKNVTKHFPKNDEEGDAITWESAIDIYPAFKKYIEDYPDIADAANRLCGRTRNMGQHAGGFIISSVPLSDFVPLVSNKKDGMITAFAEGQSSQDLGQIGLVKYDLLRIKTQQQIKDCIGLIRQRHGVDKICAIGNSTNWSDISYLNDAKAIKAANDCDLRFVFQFDSDGIRRLVKMGGVTCFDDLMAYTALYRPGPLNTKMHEVYCNRKNGKDTDTLHPLMASILHDTYGVMVYQESVMSVLNIIGKIPLRDCYALIKAISKKKLDKFAKYKEQFIANAQIALTYSKEEAENLWKQIESFAAYGFNKSHSCAYTYLTSRQLYLKTHYPVEFYCSTLMNIDGAERDEKLRDCKRDAESHGIRVNAIDINKSNVNFSIVDNEIYYGISDIKYVGETTARRIVEIREAGGPFKNFADFLKRFGFDAKVIQALISLRVFRDSDPITLWRYYEAYKKYAKSKEGRKKTYNKALIKYQSLLASVVGNNDVELSEETLDHYLNLFTNEGSLAKVAAIKKIQGSFRRSVTRTSETAIYDPGAPKLESFKITQAKLKPELVEMLVKPEIAEFFFYGFGWTHPLTNCDLASGFTFERHRRNYFGNEVGPIEGQIIENKETTSKKGTKYRVLKMIDANWECKYVQIWLDDYERFSDLLLVGSLVRLQVTPPDPKFSGARYTLKSYPKWQKHLIPSKSIDVRVVVLKEPPSDNYDDILDINKSQAAIDLIAKANATMAKAKYADDYGILDF